MKQPLIPGKKYYAEFFVSLQDSLQRGVSDMGAWLSDNGIGSESQSQILAHTPQVEGLPGHYLIEKQGWQKVSGSFYAQGGEKFITIGCFSPDSEIDTVFVGGSSNGGQYDYRGSGYYIDDVMVRLDTSVGIDEPESISTTLYPNPNDGNMYLEYVGLSGDAQFELYDITGRTVGTYPIKGEAGKLNITGQGLTQGIYMYRVIDRDKVFHTGKVVINR